MKFYKFHGIGNSFIILDYENDIDYRMVSKFLCNENISVGADGLIVSKNEEMIFYNKDGTEADFCGNAIRCLVNYIYVYKYKKNKYFITTKSGIKEVCVLDDEKFKTSVKFDEIIYKNRYIKAGVWHKIIEVNNINKFTEDKEKNININYVEIINKNILKIKTNEKGVGYTSCCGSGTVATCCYLYKKKLVNSNIKIIYDYGELFVRLSESVYLTGNSNIICEGEIKNG